MPMYTPIFAMHSGTIEYVNSTLRTADAGLNIRLAHNAGSGVPIIQPSTPAFQQDMYSQYFHLDSIAINPGTGQIWKRGDEVSKGQLIALSGNTPYAPGTQIHLHFNFCIYDAATNRMALPAKYFLGHLAGWSNGNDLDFVQPPRFVSDGAGTQVEVIAYGMGGSSPTNLEVVALIGYGTPSVPLTLVRDPANPRRYYGSLSGLGYNGTTANVYIQVKRPGVSLTRYVTRPMQYQTNPPAVYYSVYIQGPSK